MDKIFGKDEKTKELFLSYIKRLGLKSIENNLGERQIKKIFLKMMEDFLDQRLGIDDLSILCEKLSIIVTNSATLRDKRIEWEFLEAGDLNWYLRNAPEEAGKMLAKLITYYQKVKKELN